MTNRFSLITEVGYSGIIFKKLYRDLNGYTSLFQQGTSYNYINFGTRYYFHKFFAGISFGYAATYGSYGWWGNAQISPHIGYTINNRLNISSKYFLATVMNDGTTGGFIALKLQANLKK